MRVIKMKTLLVTGGAGFIGCNYIKMIQKKYPKYHIVNIDALTYAGNLENLSKISKNNYTFIKLDIRDRSKINSLFKKFNFDYVINFAAESHVDRSIEDPEVFLSTNTLGTQVLLDAAYKSWKLDPSDKYSKKYKKGVKFLQVSTDEVYGALGEKGYFIEDTPLNPNSPYSASKASADLVVRSYYKTFGLPINITRCSNNYGPFQFPEKLIPLMINNCLNNKELPLYGDGKQIRDWLHVNDHCTAIDSVLHKGIEGEIYNIGGNNEKANIDIVKLIVNKLNKSRSLIRFIKDRPGHDRRYAIDNTKITKHLGWKPSYTFERGIEETINWYLDNQKWIKNIVSGDYKLYYNRIYK
jgi:dTDP-glucose 4,6-dehydratase